MDKEQYDYYYAGYKPYKEFHFYKRKLSQLFFLGAGCRIDHDLLRRLYVYRYMFIFIGPYELGIYHKGKLHGN